ncbi:MAG TPA: carboxypeptidase-like regulatory domain-containing protein [Candidatus Sulfotelmatobacter sp.]|nr:carboxypeptidase-like regulatory domain-containing protein [Candidatus Sulfotelmatobacter sp.]
MKRRIYISILLLCAIGVWIWLPFPQMHPAPQERPEAVKTNGSASVSDKKQHDQTQSAAASTVQRTTNNQAQVGRIEDMKQELRLWRTPLLYYGKVVDESNQPIAGVRVSYYGNAADESLTKEAYNEGAVTTDQRGFFKIDGLYGIGLMFQLSHPDYYPYPDNSTGFDVRSPPRDGIVENSEANARIFRMYHKGHPVALVHRTGGAYVPLDGKQSVLFLRGADGMQKIGELDIEATGTPPSQYSREPFDWNVKFSAIGGGFVEYTNQFDFIAPDSGYQPSVEFSFPKDASDWTDIITKSYFVELPSGYARLNVYIAARSPLFFSVQYDYNPDGSRNLERQ